MKSIEYYISALRYAAEEAYKNEVVDTDMVDHTDQPKEEWICDKMQEWLEGGAEQNPRSSDCYAGQGNSEGKGCRPSDDKILNKAKEVIPEDLYKDCGGYVTIEDRNESKRNTLIKGINIGLNWPTDV